MTPVKRDDDDGPAFRLHSWGDALAALSIAAMLVAGLAWGLKLEGRLELQQLQFSEREKHMLDRIEYMERSCLKKADIDALTQRAQALP